MSNEQDMQDGAESGRATGRYIHIAPKSHPLRGKLIENVSADDPDGIKRTYTTKALEGKPSVEKTVYEKPYSAITGTIEGLYVRTRSVDFGEGLQERHSVVLVLLMNGERMLIEVEEESRYWSAFWMAMPNIDIAKKLRVETYDYDRKSDGERKVGLTFKQSAIGTIPAGAEIDAASNTYQVPWYWTKENPGKLPPAEKVEHPKTKKIEWYFDERDKYLREVVAPAMAERIAKRHEAAMAEPVEAAPAPKSVMDAMVETATAIAKKNEGIPLPQIEDGPGDDLPF